MITNDQLGRTNTTQKCCSIATEVTMSSVLTVGVIFRSGSTIRAIFPLSLDSKSYCIVGSCCCFYWTVHFCTFQPSRHYKPEKPLAWARASGLIPCYLNELL